MLTEISLGTDDSRIFPARIIPIELPDPNLDGFWRSGKSHTVSTNGSGIFTGASGHTVSWRLKSSKLWISLLDLNGDSNGSNILEFSTQVAILENCVALSQLDHSLVVDFLTCEGVMYTLHFPYKCFFDWSPPHFWKQMKKPLNFYNEVPLKLHAVDAHTLVVCLSNGELAKLSRHDPLDNVDIDARFNSSESFLRRMVSSQTVPDHPKLSVHAPIAVASTESDLITYSINNEILWWDLAKLTVKKTIPGKNAAHYLVQPSNYLKVSGTQVCVFNIDCFVVYASYEPKYKLSIPNPVKGWHLVDYVFDAATETLVAGWKSDGVSRIFEISESSTQEVNPKHFPYLVPDKGDLDRFFDNIVSTFSLDIIMKAFEKSGGEILDGDSTLSLRSSIFQLLGEDTLTWASFATLCQSIEASEGELFSLVSSNGVLWTMRRSFPTILVRKQTSERNEVSELIDKLWGCFSAEAAGSFERALQSYLETTCIGATAMASIYENHIEPYLNEESIIDVRSSMEELENLDNALLNLLNFSYKDECIQDSPLTPVGIAAISGFALRSAGEFQELTTKVLLFTFLAMGEKLIDRAVQIFRSGTQLLRSAKAILSLQVPLGSSGKYNIKVAVLQICLLQHPLRIKNINSLLPAVWKLLDFTRGDNAELLLTLLKERWDSASLLAAAQYLGNDKSSLYVKACALLTNPNSRASGVKLARKISLSKCGVSGNRGSGLSNYYIELAKLCGAYDLGIDSALEFAKLAAQYAPRSGHITIFTTLLDMSLYANNDLAAYEAICELYNRGDPEFDLHLRQFLSSVLSRRPVSYICNELIFAGFGDEVAKAIIQTEVIGGVDSYRLLYCWYISRRNYVGATKALYARILDMKSSKSSSPADVKVMKELYSMSVNALSIIDPQDRWFVVAQKVITQGDIIREYEMISA